MYKETDKCRICGNKNLEVIFDLGEQCLTGVFPKVDEDFDVKGPVTLVKCTGESVCGLVQLKQSYDLDMMYGDNYGYRSGLNASMVKHLESKIAKIEEEIALSDGDVVIDIGANDGTSLKAYQNNKIDRVGVDPTIKKFSQYYPSDITQIANFFPCAEIDTFLHGRKCKVITSFSMFYDLEDPVSFSKTIADYLDSNGVWVFEQSYLPSMLTTNSFDTICHEHIEFYSMKQILHILDLVELKIIDIEMNDVNGGSVSITAARKNSVYSIPQSQIDSMLEYEENLGISDGSAFIDFSKRIEVQKEKLMNFLAECRDEGKQVYGVGASTKGNVLLQYYDINTSLLKGIAEVNHEKFGCTTPGTKIPLIDEDELLCSSPDFLVILPWHFKEFFLKNPKFKGRSLVFPLPEFEIVKVKG